MKTSGSFEVVYVAVPGKFRASRVNQDPGDSESNRLVTC